MLGLIGFLFLVEKVTVSILFERMFILGRDDREMLEEACLLFFQGSDEIYFPNL